MTERQARWLAITGFLIWMAAHVFWIFRLEINWDEFALLARASDSLVQGQLIGSGRPGFSTLLLMPIVAECREALSTALAARVLWTFFVGGILIGFWLTLRTLFDQREHADRDALIGVAMLALTPAFLRYSIQVRTDQPAIALGLFAVVFLLKSRRRVWLAGLGGVLFGLGFVSSQKLVYVAALGACLATIDTLARDALRWRRDLLRAGLVALSGLLTIGAFRALVGLFIEPSGTLDLGSQMSTFSIYRSKFGYGYYMSMLPGLLVPLTLLALIVLRLPFVLVSRPAERRDALLVLSIVLLGLVVGGFHAGAFPYFWMTLGLFPAAAIAAGVPLLRGWFKERYRRRAGVFMAAMFFATAGVVSVHLSRDGQTVQRESLTFVESNFPPSVEGFHDTRALFCRDGANPFPTYFSFLIPSRFDESDGRPRAQEFIDEFRRRPVAFIVQTFRIEDFPPKVRRFWAEHYVPYRAAVLVPGVDLTKEAVVEFEVIVPGEYTLHADDSDTLLEVDGEPLKPGNRLYLDEGRYTVRQIRGKGRILFTLALPSPPGPTTHLFYTEL